MDKLPSNLYEALVSILNVILSGLPVPEIQAQLLEIIDTGHLSAQLEMLMKNSLLSIESQSSRSVDYSQTTAYCTLATAENCTTLATNSEAANSLMSDLLVVMSALLLTAKALATLTQQLTALVSEILAKLEPKPRPVPAFWCKRFQTYVHKCPFSNLSLCNGQLNNYINNVPYNEYKQFAITADEMMYGFPMS